MAYQCPGKIRESGERQDTCDYCGSLNPVTFMDLCEKGLAKLTPTDKNYKVYVDHPESEPDKIRIVAHAWNVEKDPKSPGGPQWKVWDRGDQLVDGMSMKNGDWYQESPRGPVRNSKFYFEHLNEEQQKRFVELYNEKKLNIGYPGYFYRWPFFMCPVK